MTKITERSTCEEFILSSLLYIIFLLTHFLLYLILSLIIGIVAVCLTIISGYNEYVEWARARQRRGKQYDYCR